MRLIVADRGLDLAGAKVHQVDARGSYREALGRALGVLPRSWFVTVVHQGRRLEAHELDLPAADDADVLVGPEPRGTIVLGAAWTVETILAAAFLTAAGTIVLAGIGQAVQKLLGPKPEQTQADDESSPTHGWSGIRTGVGQGFRTPMAYGLIRVGFNIIASRVRSLAGFTSAEVLDLVLLASSGRCESIAGLTGGDSGEVDGIGGFFVRDPSWPNGILVNGNELQQGEGELSLRMGELTQTPFAKMPQASTALAVDAELNRTSHAGTAAVPTASAKRVNVRITFPGGLFKQDKSSGAISSYRVDYEVWWRHTGGGPDFLLDAFSEQQLRRERYFIDRTYDLLPTDPYTVVVRRVGDEGAGPSYYIQSDSLFQTLTYEIAGVIAYAGRTVALLSILANERQQQSVDTVTMLAKARRVRVWDPTHGLSTFKTWELPASGVFSGIWSYPPGRNPAWVALDILLTHDGLNLLREKAVPLSINYAQFRDLADYCDETVDGAARFTFDDVFDAGEGILEALARVLTVCRATWVIRGNEFGVVYEYRDAHGRGSNAVPARAAVTMINQSEVEDFQIRYLDTIARPNVIDVQILNAALDYEQDLVSVEDIEAAGLNLPHKLNAEAVRRGTLQLFGCTDAGRARKEAIYYHLLNRLTATEISFVAGVRQIAAEIKDVVAVQHDVFQPYDQPSHGYRTTSSGVSPTVTLDHQIVVNSAIGQTWIMVVDAAGALQVRQVTMGNGTYTPGTPLTLSATVDFKRGSPVTIGFQDKLVREYVITRISRMADPQNEHKRRVELVQWTPDAFDVPASFSTVQDHSQASVGLGATAQLPPALGVRLNPLAPGTTRVGITLPAGFRGRRGRISVARWDGKEQRSYGASVGEAVDIESLEPHRDYRVAVAYEDRQGALQTPAGATEFYVHAPEFPAANPGLVQGLRWSLGREGIWLLWDPLDDSHLDYYEVRRGPCWNGAERIARTKETQALIAQHASGQQTYHIRAKHRSGCYSQQSTRLVITPGLLPGTLSYGTVTDLAAGAAGTAVDCAWDAGLAALVFSGLKVAASYTAAQLNCSTVALRHWSVTLDRWWVDTDTSLAELAHVKLGSGEARWRTLAGREASPHKPGAELWTPISAHTELLSDCKDRLAGAPGMTGRHADVRIEARYDTTGSPSWSAWEDFRAGWRQAQRIEVRLLLRRWRRRFSLRLRNLRVEASA